MDFDLLDQNESETQGNAIRYKSELKKECCRCKEKNTLGVTDRPHEIAGRDLFAVLR